MSLPIGDGFHALTPKIRVVADAHLAFEVSRGMVVIFIFFPRELRRRLGLAKIVLHNCSSDVKRKTEVMGKEAEQRGIGFEFMYH